MRHLIIAALVFTLVTPAATQAPASPTESILISVILKHDQSRNRDEMVKILEDQGFLAKFPPDGMAVESWYVMMGLGHVITVRVPVARLRDFNRAIEDTA